MTDPLSILAGGDEPLQPRPEFARQLKQQLTRQTDRETNMTHSASTPSSTAASPASSTPGGSLTGGVSNLFYFTLPAPDLDQAKRFYHDVFGWDTGGGSLGGHIQNVTPAGGLSPGARPDTRTVFFTVDDVEVAAQRVKDLGGTVEGDINDYETGRMIQCRDDQGTAFCLQEPAPGEYTDYARNPKKASQHGDLFYFSLPVADGDRGRSFYSALLGWQLSEAGGAGGMHAENMITDGGIGGGRDGDRAEFWFQVNDIAQSVEKVRAAGGTADEPMDTPQGQVAACADDQGVEFGIIQPVAP